jgi:Ca2+-binding RTX toxin-like protein
MSSPGTSVLRRGTKTALHLFLCFALIATGLIGSGLMSASAAPVGQGFTVTPSDLRTILRQIKIAEAHANAYLTNTPPNPDPAGDPYYCQAMLGTGPNQIPSPLVSEGLRTVTGDCNNLIPGSAFFGASHTVFPRLASPIFQSAEVNPPAFGPPGPQTSYTQTSGLVFDSRPRTISNLIVDQTSTNPAAVFVSGNPARTQGADGFVPCTTEPTTPGGTDGLPAGCIPAHQTLPIENVTTDVGLSPPFNSLFTIFGQFFDHGVDQTVKGGNGTVIVPLKDDDPLVAGPDHIFGNSDDLAPQLRFMPLTRASIRNDPVTGIRSATNTDSSFVDQSQTYTSDPSHQVFLREYVNNINGLPVATGELIHSSDDGMASWAEVKAQAASLLGLLLTDADVTDVPKIVTDPYGNFVPGPARGLPMYMTATGPVEGDTANPVPVPNDVLHIEIPFLTDIAHSAAPTFSSPGVLFPDTDGVAGLSLDATDPVGSYDDELLNQHFICGDGRCNENIALTAVHQMFHSEHDRLVGDIKQVLLADAAAGTGITSLADWQLATGAADLDGVWNGERLFQAARFVTEMEYQHLVFEEFARKVQPLINPFQPFAFTQTDINPAVHAEFAAAVYRFGHSMLTDTIARTNADGSHNDIPLLDGFLNPGLYRDGGTAGQLLAPEAAGAIIMGMSDQAGQEIDEFVVETLRNNLLGLPLDLPTINMTRARSEGVPPLNEFRKQLYAATSDSQLIPYGSWTDFGQGIKHPSSLINFVAAYGTHPNITREPNYLDKREAARLIVDPTAADITNFSCDVNGQLNGANDPCVPADAAQFMDSFGPWTNAGADNENSITGVDSIDLWMGGLAEQTNAFGGLLGSTFNFVFESQLTDLQNSDRLYYLARTPGMNLRTQLEGNSFAELVERNTNAHTLKADSFATADCKFQLANLAGTPAGYTQFGSSVNDDPTTECNERALLIRSPNGQIKYRATNTVDPPGINGQSVYNGTANLDRIFGGVDSDTFWGNEGNDIIEGGDGADVVLGGDGNDKVTDLNGDDVLKGGPGNDAIEAGPGLDIIISGSGKDFTNGGANINETFAGPGDDFIMLGQGEDAAFGDSGDDWQEGGDQPDLMQGDSGGLFFTDPNKPGNDILIGQAGDDDYDAEGGDDMLVTGPGIEKNAGAAGYDFSIGVGDPIAQNADLALPILPPDVIQVGVRDRFNEVEALSGWKFNDKLRGDDVFPSQVGGVGFIGCDALDQNGLDRITGLDPLVPPLSVPTATVVANSSTNDCPLTGPLVWGEGNIIMGGTGSDLIEGRGADDIIDGDRWLNVRLSVRSGVDADGNATGPEIGSTDLMTHAALTGNFGANTTATTTLQQAVMAQKVNPGQIVAVREVITPTVGAPDCGALTPLNCDTALFSDAIDNYTITNNPDGSITVAHVGGTAADGIDTVRNVERLQFTDATVGTANQPATGVPTLSTTTPQQGVALTASTTGITDADGLVGTTFNFQWQAGTTDILGATSASFTPTTAEVGQTLRVVVSFVDNAGNREQVISASTAAVTPSAVVGPVVVANTALGFGGNVVGTVITKTFRLTNNGPGNLVVASASSSNPAFVVTLGTCTAPVAVTRSCRLNVTFTVGAVQRYTGVLTVLSNASNSPTTATLTGRGTL